MRRRWSSQVLVGLVTRRSRVRIPPPLMKKHTLISPRYVDSGEHGEHGEHGEQAVVVHVFRLATGPGEDPYENVGVVGP
jgi:hypothetical protein